MILVKDDYLNKRTNKRIYYEEQITHSEYEERELKKMNLRKMLRLLEAKDKLEYNKEHKNGYCPKCGMLIPLSGECDCGYRR